MCGHFSVRRARKPKVLSYAHHLKEQSHDSATHLPCDGEQIASPLCAQVLSSLKWDEMILYTQNLVQPREGAQLMAAFLPKMIPQEVGKVLKGLE